MTPHSRNPFSSRSLILVLPAAALIFCGCVSPDLWPVFSPSSQTPQVCDTEPEPYWRMPGDTDAHHISATPARPRGNSLTVSLEQALLMAMKANPDLKVEKENPRLAGFREEAQRGRFDPVLFSELSFGKTRALEPNDASGRWQRTRETNGNALIGLSQELPTGTGFEIGLEHTRDDDDTGPDENEIRLGLTVTQALLQGYGTDVNLATVRQAELNTRATHHELEGFAQAVIADTEMAYWDHVLARQEIDIFEASLAVAEKQLFEVEQRIDVGTLPPIESAAAKAEVALRRQALIDARSTLEETRFRLLYFIHPAGNEEEDFQVTVTSPAVSEPEPETDLVKRLRLACRMRPDLNEARLRMEENRLELVKTRNGLLPRLDLFINLGKSGYADAFSGAFKNMNDTAHDMSAGIRFSLPLENRKAQAEHNIAGVTLEQAEAALETMTEIIHRDVRIALNDADRSRRQIDATRITRQHQEEALTAEQERFDVGTSTGLLVAQAQRDLLASRIREVEAVVAYRKALVRLYLAEGSLLDRRGIQLQGAADSAQQDSR